MTAGSMGSVGVVSPYVIHSHQELQKNLIRNDLRRPSWLHQSVRTGVDRPRKNRTARAVFRVQHAPWRRVPARHHLASVGTFAEAASPA